MQIHGKIQFVNPPEGNRPGSLKIDGRYISVPTQLLPQFQRGSNVVLDVKEKEVNGRTYYNLLNVISNGDVAQAQRTNGNGIAQNAPRHEPHTQHEQPEPHKNSAAKEIFVTSFVKESTRIGKCNLGNLTDYAKAAKSIWEQIMEGKTMPYPTAQPRFQPGDLNDDISDIGGDHPPF